MNRFCIGFYLSADASVQSDVSRRPIRGSTELQSVLLVHRWPLVQVWLSTWNVMVRRCWTLRLVTARWLQSAAIKAVGLYCVPTGWPKK